MKIWIDADGCPGDVKELVCRAGERLKVPVVLVANRPMKIVRSPFVSLQVVSAGLDVADGEIVRASETSDLAITADIPLASALVGKGVVTIDPRGELYSPANIGEKLAMRNMMQELRGAGLVSGGAGSYGAREKQRFAATLDRELTRLLRESGNN